MSLRVVDTHHKITWNVHQALFDWFSVGIKVMHFHVVKYLIGQKSGFSPMSFKQWRCWKSDRYWFGNWNDRNGAHSKRCISSRFHGKYSECYEIEFKKKIKTLDTCINITIWMRFSNRSQTLIHRWRDDD